MKVINRKIKEELKRTECLSCGAELEYDACDVHEGVWGMLCVTCPECGEETFVSEDRVIVPTWDKTFCHTSDDSAVHIEDAEVQKFVDKCYKALTAPECEAGESYTCGCGDVLVIGVKTNDEITIYVTRDWYEDVTCVINQNS